MIEELFECLLVEEIICIKFLFLWFLFFGDLSSSLAYGSAVGMAAKVRCFERIILMNIMKICLNLEVC